MRFTTYVNELHTFVIYVFCTHTAYLCAPNALPYTLIQFVFMSQPNQILYIVQNYY